MCGCDSLVENWFLNTHEVMHSVSLLVHPEIPEYLTTYGSFLDYMCFSNKIRSGQK